MFEDRQYQTDAIDYIINEPDDRRPILCAPTGSGKTVICAKIAKHYLDQGKTFGFLTPREEILWQNHGVMQEICGQSNVSVFKAGENWRSWLPIHIISWPTLRARAGKEHLLWPDVDVLAIDEAHLSLSHQMVEKVLPHYLEKGTKIFGVTATPARKSGKGLGDFFTFIKNVTSVRQLVKDGYLAPCEYWGGELADLTGVQVVRGDYNEKQLAAACAPLVGDVIDNWARLASGRHTIVYAVNIAHCEALTERFQQAGVKAAALHIHKTPERRHEINVAFKRREIQVLVNVTIASYGYDAPSVDCIVLASPTKSVVLWLQRIGRGMRPHPDKEFCMVIDHTGGVRDPELGYADDLRRWRLDKRKEASGNWSRDDHNEKKEESKTHECEECLYIFSRSLACPKCGWEVPLPKKDVAAVDADLVRISRQMNDGMPKGWPEPRRFYLMLLYHARMCGMNEKWAYFSYRDFAAENIDLRPTSAPLDWKSEEGIRPTIRVKNWISQRRKAYVEEQRAKEPAAA